MNILKSLSFYTISNVFTKGISLLSMIMLTNIFSIEKYGITVSDNEILDWVRNRPETLPDPIKRNFMDSTGVFNAGFYQQALGMKTKEATQFWSQVENYLRETLLSEKLQAILSQGVVVSEADILEKYKDENMRANMSYAFLDLNSLTDSALFAVTDNELKEYYEKHKNDFKQEEAVKLKYVQFLDLATAEDSSIVMKQMERFKKDMQTANVEDSSLIKMIFENSSVSWLLVSGEIVMAHEFRISASKLQAIRTAILFLMRTPFRRACLAVIIQL